MESIVVISDMCKRYHKQEVLDHVDMTISKGDIYGLVGKNGAGKTTLIKILFGLSSPSPGSFSISGIQNDDVRIQSVREKMSGIVEQPAFYPYMSAYENMKAHAILCDVHDDQRINHLLDLVGLKDVGRKKVRNFSLGMKQRLGIARALLTDPELIVLDEPTNGLDPEGIIDLRDLIKTLNSKYGITFLICSHYISELERIINKIGIIKHGKLIEEEKIEEIKKGFIATIRIKVDKIDKGLELLKDHGIYVDLQGEELCINENAASVDELMTIFSENQVNICKMHNEAGTLEQYVLGLIRENDEKQRRSI